MENESIGCGTSSREPWLQTVAEVFKGFLQKRKAELFRRMGRSLFDILEDSSFARKFTNRPKAVRAVPARMKLGYGIILDTLI